MKYQLYTGNSIHFVVAERCSSQIIKVASTVYPVKYAHGFCFTVLCCGYTLTDFPISIRLTSLALWQSNDCPSASKATLMNMDKYFMCIHYERLHNHNKAKRNTTVCIFLGIYCNRVGQWVTRLREISGPGGSKPPRFPWPISIVGDGTTDSLHVWYETVSFVIDNCVKGHHKLGKRHKIGIPQKKMCDLWPCFVRRGSSPTRFPCKISIGTNGTTHYKFNTTLYMLVLINVLDDGIT